MNNWEVKLNRLVEEIAKILKYIQYKLITNYIFS